ncbi:GNAT family N-acetyltransferase [Aeromicrobium sp.]|uniref:GNAT family N-acetyltransferase n=1 Tax=Aeromicrobium sp. TaxID=1871063 RepID=UPI003D6ABF68
MTLRSQWYETPDLVGDHVKLVQLHPDHAAGLLAAADDDEVFRWQSFARPTTLDEAARLHDWYLARPDTITWTQIDRASNAVAGMTTFYEIDPVNRSVAIGVTWLGRRFWRTAVNTEAKLLLMRRAFDDLGCARVVWHVDIANERSQAAVERIGGVREGVLRKHRVRRDGSWRDTVVFSMTDDEWPAACKVLEERLAP